MRRDRHDRGRRDIRTASAFDYAMGKAIDRINEQRELSHVAFEIEEIPPNLCADDVTLGRYEDDGGKQRIVIYRRPIELRVDDEEERDRLIYDTLVEQVADLLGISPEEVDHQYGCEY